MWCVCVVKSAKRKEPHVTCMKTITGRFLTVTRKRAASPSSSSSFPLAMHEFDMLSCWHQFQPQIQGDFFLSTSRIEHVCAPPPPPPPLLPCSPRRAAPSPPLPLPPFLPPLSLRAAQATWTSTRSTSRWAAC